MWVAQGAKPEPRPPDPRLTCPRSVFIWSQLPPVLWAAGRALVGLVSRASSRKWSDIFGGMRCRGSARCWQGLREQGWQGTGAGVPGGPDGHLGTKLAACLPEHCRQGRTSGGGLLLAISPPAHSVMWMLTEERMVSVTPLSPSLAPPCLGHVSQTGADWEWGQTT